MSMHLPPPPQMAHLPLDERGVVVPWFVPVIDGKPDFQYGDDAKLRSYFVGRRYGDEVKIRGVKCWICGKTINSPTGCFVGGPLVVLNMNSAEPPSHKACAVYAVQACPFMTSPKKVREGGPKQDTFGAPPMLEHNPGVAAIWETTSFTCVPSGRGGAMFLVGSAARVSWWTRGRPATREEAADGIDRSVAEVSAQLNAQGVMDDELRIQIGQAWLRAERHLPPASMSIRSE